MLISFKKNIFLLLLLRWLAYSTVYKLTYIHHEMMITVSLANIHHLLQYKIKEIAKFFLSCDKNS